MDSSNAQHHHQEMSSQTLESMLVCTKAQQDKKPRPPEQALKCPRCDSTNTKFCYYNNYSLTQPRYFCKSCRRYWTKGGTLRNVPVGGGCRKNRRSSSSSSSSSSKKGQDPNPFQPNPNPLSSLTSMMPYDSDISLALARLQKHSMNGGGNLFDHDHHQQQPIDPNMMQNNPNHNQTNFFDSLRGSGFADGQNQNHQAFQNLYYGGGNNVNNIGHDQEMTSAMVGYESSSYDREMSVKQEMSRADAVNGNDGGSSKVLWGFPWQVNAGGDVSNGGDHHNNLDSGRQQMMMSSSWNNGFGASWQGLLNSAPLM